MIPDRDQERRLNDWLAEHGVEGRRRIVRSNPPTTLVSKFEPGFALALVSRIESMPALFDSAQIASRYAEVAAATPELPRAEAWRQAVLARLAEAAEDISLDPPAVAEVGAGVDSVAALLDSVLFTAPAAGSTAPVSDAEDRAYREAIEKMDAAAGMFTRNYGTFEGGAVVNHCPGSRFARQLLAQAWEICSGRS